VIIVATRLLMRNPDESPPTSCRHPNRQTANRPGLGRLLAPGSWAGLGRPLAVGGRA
jgi:hypothetical protein